MLWTPELIIEWYQVWFVLYLGSAEHTGPPYHHFAYVQHAYNAYYVCTHLQQQLFAHEPPQLGLAVVLP